MADNRAVPGADPDKDPRENHNINFPAFLKWVLSNKVPDGYRTRGLTKDWADKQIKNHKITLGGKGGMKKTKSKKKPSAAKKPSTAKPKKAKKRTVK